jgi:hypothetical protein
VGWKTLRRQKESPGGLRQGCKDMIMSGGIFVATALVGRKTLGAQVQ